MAEVETAGSVSQGALDQDTGHWFDRSLCGVFFHWGPYSVAGRGEWVMNRERIPLDEYRVRYVEPWAAENFDPDAWMLAAKDLGADYVVLTTRHHDGFALWDSGVNAFNSVRVGPRRDIVEEFVAAARRHGLRIGFYYSLANWVHPDYPQGFYRDWPEDEDWASEESRAGFRAYNRAELKELLTRYGQVDYLWFDGHFPANVRSDSLNALIREWQPGILINDRNGPTGDVRISEQGIRGVNPGSRWEACFTLNRNWGFHRNDPAFKRPEDLLELLLKVRHLGGNLLLNVGPDGSGMIPQETRGILSTCGRWIRDHRGHLADLTSGGFGWNNSAAVSAAGESVLLHFFQLPARDFCWAETKTELLRVRLLPDDIPVEFEQVGERIFLRGLDRLPRNRIFTTVELLFKTSPVPATPLTTFWIPD